MKKLLMMILALVCAVTSLSSYEHPCDEDFIGVQSYSVFMEDVDIDYE